MRPKSTPWVPLSSEERRSALYTPAVSSISARGAIVATAPHWLAGDCVNGTVLTGRLSGTALIAAET